MVANWIDADGTFQQTTLPTLQLLGKQSDEIAETLSRLLRMIGCVPKWYSSDSEATTGAAIRKLNKKLNGKGKQANCTLHSLNNSISDSFKKVFGVSFFSQVEKATNFVRAYWNKLNNTFLGSNTKLRRPVKATDVRWLTHLLSASYFADSASAIVSGIIETWDKLTKTGEEVKSLLEDPKFLLQCSIMKVFGLQMFLPCFHWLQEKRGRRISELPNRIRQWLNLYTLIDAQKEEIAAAKGIDKNLISNWIHELCVVGREQTRKRFNIYFQPHFVVAEIVESPQMAKQYLEKIASLNAIEKSKYDMFGLLSNPTIYQSFRSWNQAASTQILASFPEGKALWDWYIRHYSIIVIHSKGFGLLPKITVDLHNDQGDH